jgi:hypothetical protein
MVEEIAAKEEEAVTNNVAVIAGATCKEAQDITAYIAEIAAQPTSAWSRWHGSRAGYGRNRLCQNASNDFVEAVTHVRKRILWPVSFLVNHSGGRPSREEETLSIHFSCLFQAIAPKRKK